MMYRVVVALVLLVFSSTCFAITMGEAIDVAGQQRMLSQRMAQYYLLQGIKPNSEKAVRGLSDSISIFENNLTELRKFQPGTSVKADLKKVAVAWSKYKVAVSAKPSKENAKAMLDSSNEVLALAHEYVQKLQALSSESSAELVSISGRQRMLSQRIAKNYLAYYWGVDGEHCIQSLYVDLAEYESVLNYLLESELNTPEINTKLQKVLGYFKFASKGFDGAMKISGDRLVHVTTGTTDVMLKNMNDVTKMYAALLGNS